MVIKGGVEEAGRGPVIGPMVMCAACIEEKDEHKLTKIGVKDSKKLTPAQREELYPKILKMVKSYATIKIPIKEIDEAVTSKDPNLNLNWLEANKSGIMLNKLKPNYAVLDCPTNNLKSYQEFMLRIIKTKSRIVCEHKADVNHPIVSAASIIAKVLRDREIKKLKAKYNIEFGSGYPSDPRTVEFLDKNYDKYPIFRKSWQTYKKVVQKKNQKQLGDY